MIDKNHPKTIRRHLLLLLYDHYQADPLEMVTPEMIQEPKPLSRQELISNIYYLQDRGLVELMRGYNPPFFSAARITADGIDLVENRFELDLRFPPAIDEIEESQASIPHLMERLVDEADFAALDGEERRALLHDVQFLREEVARPVHRWRIDVVIAVLDWIEGHFSGADVTWEESLPSLAPLRRAIDKARAEL